MFQNCESLKQAPDLPATTLAEDWYGCYQYMFYGCSSLSFVKIGYTGDYNDSYFAVWVEGVAEFGIFNYEGSQSPQDFGFPQGWTIPADPVDLCMIVHVNENTIVRLNSNGNNNPDLSYSIDGKNWTKYTEPITLSTGDDLYLKGDNSNGFSKSTTVYSYFSFTGNVSISGSIMGLLDDGSASMSAIPNEYCFYGLFRDCSTIISVDKDFLKSAETLANNCYDGMFYGCESLTQVPELPATTLANYCYYCMFESCTSLENAPKLPAETLADSCYGFMFYGCESLTQAPDLPATTLACYCYYGMFDSCTSLTQAPELPATTLAENCYQNMFDWCTSLTQVPDLPAKTLVDSCYDGMFDGCTSLENAPDLSAETLANNCYSYMFYGCSSLSSVTIGYTGNFDPVYFYRWVEGVAKSGIFYYGGGQTPQDFGFPDGWHKPEGRQIY